MSFCLTPNFRWGLILGVRFNNRDFGLTKNKCNRFSIYLPEILK
jgi:hypothetical protein